MNIPSPHRLFLARQLNFLRLLAPIIRLRIKEPVMYLMAPRAHLAFSAGLYSIAGMEARDDLYKCMEERFEPLLLYI